MQSTEKNLFLFPSWTKITLSFSKVGCGNVGWHNATLPCVLQAVKDVLSAQQRCSSPDHVLNPYSLSLSAYIWINVNDSKNERKCTDLYSCLKVLYRALHHKVTIMPSKWQLIYITTVNRSTLGWILGKNSSWKEWLGTGACCPGGWWGHHPWRCSRKGQK